MIHPFPIHPGKENHIRIVIDSVKNDVAVCRHRDSHPCRIGEFRPLGNGGKAIHAIRINPFCSVKSQENAGNHVQIQHDGLFTESEIMGNSKESMAAYERSGVNIYGGNRRSFQIHIVGCDIQIGMIDERNSIDSVGIRTGCSGSRANIQMAEDDRTGIAVKRQITVAMF